MTTKLEAIRAREQAATPGEWANVGRSVRVDGTTGGNAWQGAICNTIGGGYQSRKADRVNVQARANAAFIAHARADIPLLLAVAEAAAEWLRAKRRLNEYQEHGPLDIDTIYQLMTANRQAREAFWNAIAPLMEEVSDDNQA